MARRRLAIFLIILCELACIESYGWPFRRRRPLFSRPRNHHYSLPQNNKPEKQEAPEADTQSLIPLGNPIAPWHASISNHQTQNHQETRSIVIVPSSTRPLNSDLNRPISRPDVELQDYAQPQINQGGTGTCAFNAATGIMEIMYALWTGRRVNFSEPAFLTNRPGIGAKETSWFWEKLYDDTPEYMVANHCLPGTSTYQRAGSFQNASSIAESVCRRGLSDSDKIKLPFKLQSEKLFFKANWNNGYMNTYGRATTDDFNKTVKWFKEHGTPVNIHHKIGNIWHSVIMLDHRPAGVLHGEQVFIKDSLGGSGVGSWKSKTWFLNNVYGAIGVDFASEQPPDYSLVALPQLPNAQWH